MKPIIFVVCLIALFGAGARADEQTQCAIRHEGDSWVLTSTGLQGLAAGDLALRSEMPNEDTGTMHYAARTTIALGSLRPIVFGGGSADGEDEGPMPPILERQFKLDESRYLVLGWSSRGAGMQTQHAYLVQKKAHALSIADELDFESFRGESRLLVRADPGSTSIGIVTPDPTYWRGDNLALSRDRWTLRVGKKSFDLERLRASHSRELHPGSCDFFCYAPPQSDCRHETLQDHRVVWIDVIDNHFVLEHEDRRN